MSIIQIDDFIGTLSGDLEPLHKLVKRIGIDGSEVNDDGIALSRRPHVAPYAYALRLYTPLPNDVIQKYQSLYGGEPSSYFKILAKLNGLHAFEMSMFGIPRSMTNDSPLLNRTSSQPYDLGTANRFWKKEYDVPEGWFHFGGGPYTLDENIGYFTDFSERIRAIRKNGHELGSWTSFHQFLSDELRRAEEAYPVYEEFIAKQVKGNSIPKPWWKRLFNH